MASEQREPLMNLAPEAERETRNRKSTYHGLNLAEHDIKYGRIAEDPLSRKAVCRRAFTAKCTAKNFLKWIVSKVPAVNVLRTYKLRKYIAGDIIAGLSVGVVTIPQSLGYARLAGVPAILGLYTSFFPVLVYFVFGSSRHVSMGTMALCSLIIAETVRKEGSRLSSFSSFDNATADSNGSFTQKELGQISVAVSISFLAGIFQVLMGVFHLGFVVSYMAEPFVSGYLMATNLRVLTHQVRDMLGLPVFRGYTGPGDYFYSVYGIVINLPNVNLMQILISILSLATLVLVKKCINERFASKLKVPIPIDIIIVIIFTVASHFGNLDKFEVEILKTIPKGLPTVMLPSADHMKNYAFDAFMLAIVAYMMVGMMAKLFSQRHNYPVDNNQELLANGLSCVGGAFFCSLAGSTSPPRCFLMETTGGKTQVAYLISAVLTLLTMLLIAPLFQSLPVCVLSSIIFVACIPLFPHYIAWIGYWKTNKYDCAIWVFTAVTNLLLSVDIGLLISMGFSLILVHFQMQRPQTSRLYVNEEDEICLDHKRYSNCQPVDDAVIFRFESPLYFATLDVFKEQLFSSTISLSFLKSKAANVEDIVDAGDLPLEVLKTDNCHVDEIIQNETNLLEKKLSSGNSDDNIIDIVNNRDDANESVKDEKANEGKREKPLPRNIIVDCSAVSFIDTSGAKTLAQLHGEYSKFNIQFLLANCCCSVVRQLIAVDQCKTLVAGSVYPSIQDALVALNL